MAGGTKDGGLELHFAAGRFLLEKGYALLDNALEDKGRVAVGSRHYGFSFPPPAVSIPELSALELHFEKILIRFEVHALRVLLLTASRESMLAPELNAQLLLKIGKACEQYRREHLKTRWATLFEIVYLHDEHDVADVLGKSLQLCYTIRAQAFMTIVWTLNKNTGRLDGSTPSHHRFLYGTFLRRIFRERGFPLEKTLDLSLSRRSNLTTFLGGVAGSLILAMPLRGLVAAGYVNWAGILVQIDMGAGLLGIVSSIYATKLRVRGGLQGFATGISYSLLLYGMLAWDSSLLNGQSWVVIIVHSAVLSLIGLYFGRQAEGM